MVSRHNGGTGSSTACGYAHLLGALRSPGVEMAVRALAGSMPEARLRATAVAFTAELPIG
ncbi:hypothetical protein ACFZBU_06880 [Embleya sp. NPDC008237]|uniref:hypothetical protein n=1 Tax=Embleya sp. NPDC008237 TaxID=3363978 RepID=UPI0036E9AECE